MTQYEQFLSIVSPFANSDAAAHKYADHLTELFAVADAAKIGPAFAEAIAAENYAEAVHQMASYFRTRVEKRTPSLRAEGNYLKSVADDALVGKVRVINIDWTFPDGEEDFLFDPTAIHGPRNNEWLWQFNRHAAWYQLGRTYFDLRDEQYAAEFRSQLLRWIAQTDIPENYNGAGSAWRTIECGLRLLGNWQVAFDGFRTSPTIEDAVLLLMIASMHRQTMHLLAHNTREGWRMGNWMLMEMNGVYTFSALYPELTDSDEHRRFAARRIIEEMKKQVLPDGVQYELSPDYHSVVSGCTVNFCELAKELGHEEDGGEELSELIHRMAHAMVLLSTPAFTQPRTNDCFTLPTTSYTRRAASLLENRDEYRFVNTKRAEGAPPAGETASAFLPYAGFAVMRSDWGPDAAYMCFDVGPTGMAHIHQDKLNIILYKGSEELLYDDGGGQYEQSDARRYGLSSYSHNIALVDGLAQNRTLPAVSEEPIDAGWITNDVFDYASASYDAEFGPERKKPAVHKREVRFCKPDFFCVADTLTSSDGEPHEYELLFHMDTTEWEPVPAYENGVISRFGGKNGRQFELLMIPVDGEEIRPEIKSVSAATEPRFQGWYNGRNESNLHPAVTVSRVVKDVRDYRFCTLLFPVLPGEPLPQVEKRPDGTVRVEWKDKITLLHPDKLGE